VSEKPLAMVEKYAYGLEANGRKKKLTGGEAEQPHGSLLRKQMGADSQYPERPSSLAMTPGMNWLSILWLLDANINLLAYFDARSTLGGRMSSTWKSSIKVEMRDHGAHKRSKRWK
jgi:hypothetical protein